MMGRFPRHLRSKVSYSRVSYELTVWRKIRDDGREDSIRIRKALLRADPMGTCWGHASAGKQLCSSLASELLENTYGIL